jgi:hypothetical protein
VKIEVHEAFRQDILLILDMAYMLTHHIYFCVHECNALYYLKITHLHKANVLISYFETTYITS